MPESDPEDRPPRRETKQEVLRQNYRSTPYRPPLGMAWVAELPIKGQPLGTTEPLSHGRVDHVQDYPMYQSDSYFVLGTLERPGGRAAVCGVWYWLSVLPLFFLPVCLSFSCAHKHTIVLTTLSPLLNLLGTKHVGNPPCV